MDIALVHPELIYPRGAEKQLCKLAGHLSSRGHDVTIYTFEYSKPYIFDSLLEKCRIVQLGKKWEARSGAGNYARWLFMCRKLAKEMGKHEIINCHNFPAPWVSAFRGEPSLWTCNEPAQIYMNPRRGIVKRGFFGLFRRLDSYLCRKLKLITALDRRMEGIIRGIYQRPVKIVGSAAELDMPVRRAEDSSTDILFVGALEAQKRPLDIVEAAGRLVKSGRKGIRLHIVGSGALENEMRSRAAALGLDVALYGNVGEGKLYELYGIADLSVYVPESQPWGIFPLESILAGIPTILSDECGVLDILRGAPVVKTGDRAALAKAIASALDDMPAMRKSVEENRKILARDYTWEKYGMRMESLYKEVLGA